MARPAFSVVIPLFNKARHIERCLASVFAQSYQPHEIIVVDDGSTDGGDRWVEALRDPRVRLLRRAPPGPGGYAARNLGIERAAGEWIAFLDADDAWLPRHLQSFAEAVERFGPAPSCVFGGYRFQEPGGFAVDDWFSRSGRPAGVYDTGRLLAIWLEGGTPWCTDAVAIRRDLLMEVGMFPAGRARRGGDRDLWLRTVLATPCIYAGEVTAVYHRDADNMLTRVEGFSVRHPIQDTIAERLRSADAGTAALLRRLRNREAFNYAVKAWKAGTPIVEPMVADFDVGIDPLRFFALRAMRAVPMPLPQAARGAIQRGLARLRRRRA